MFETFLPKIEKTRFFLFFFLLIFEAYLARGEIWAKIRGKGAELEGIKTRTVGGRRKKGKGKAGRNERTNERSVGRSVRK